jgi:uncharacterized protein
MRWTWDPKKAEANRAKHGVSFETAKAVFADPLHLSQLGPAFRRRSLADCREVGSVLLLVVHTWPEGDEDPVGRIVSARKATAHERKAYEEEGL